MTAQSQEAEPALGHIDSLWRYPVKSMAGERLREVTITDRGLAGDRGYALIDAVTGKLVSAKKPQAWGGVLECSARLQDDPGSDFKVRITLPGGEIVDSNRADAAEVISTALGRDVRLHSTAPAGAHIEYAADPLEDPESMSEFPPATASPAGTFFDFAPVHLLTTASLARLCEMYPGGRFELPRFRPNVVVQSPDNGAGFVENAWVGHVVAIGENVRLQVIEPAPRCAMTTLPQGDLPADIDILRTIARHNQATFSFAGEERPCVGVYATVLSGGFAQTGDEVRLHPAG